MHRNHATSILHLLVAFGLLSATLVAAPAVQAAGGNGLRDAANRYREAGGLAPVVGTALLDDIATVRAADMAAKGQLDHDMAYVRSRIDAAGVCWSRFGEIIAWTPGDSPDYDRTLSQWWNSKTHHDIVMRASYNTAGGAFAMAGGGYYSVMVFVAQCGDDVPLQSYGQTPFTDISASPFRNDIAWLYQSGITSGCNLTTYCPGAQVNREQMASFLARALDLPPAGRDYFGDDTGSVHEGAINRVAEAGITTGCAPRRFCPSAGVSREQMASFLVRAKRLTAGGGLNLFVDDDWSQHELDIDRLAYDGITSGCAERRYCPSSAVTREQMAAFLRRAFGG